jgi:hypothetical protein
MAELEAVLAEALEDMRAGRERTVPDYLKLVRESERAELADLLAAFYLHHSAEAGPEPVEPERFEEALDLVERFFERSAKGGQLGASLVELRESQRLRRDEVVERLAGRFELIGSARVALARAYHHLEIGQVPGPGVSGSLLRALSEIFKVKFEDLTAAARRTPGGPLRAASVYGRGAGEVGTAMPSPRRSPADRSEEKVERLFYGGPDA